ncbi:autotransporter assembly complex protein TamA [Sphingomonas jatrophae]|uniref:Autotransporter secretion outer membrane protein TamA n=1 Tax=Sphingomonas jatrophae TaxID=1166337 RepID=A0A1I6K7T1_9SPHN|nr:BamA/TamA family outer membrane protein [Sphingomonas jatrophae]SFR87098.1 autotransporter secretion outer membrane protein TamA [Sphingomonas jatrophae]
MQPVSPWRRRVRIAGCAFLLAATGPLRAQILTPASPVPEPTLDPDSPLAPLPDLGVEWPDLATSAADAPIAAAIDTAGEQRYRVALQGLGVVGTPAFLQRFDSLSVLHGGEGEPANVAQIDRRAREDEGLLRDLLRAEGYYDAGVEARVEAEAGTRRIVVTLAAEPGPRYSFREVTTPGLAAAAGKAPTLEAAFPVKAGDPVDAERVLAARTALQTALGREGFAFGTVGEPQVIVDHETRTATLALPVTTGAAQRFGTVRVEGDRLFGPRHLARIARFRPGDPYDAALVEDYRRALIQTGLVSTVRITSTPGPDGTVDLFTRLEPAPPRTVAGELGYGTGEGARAALSWTHRNLIRPEGAVTVRGVLGTQEQLAGVALRRSNYKARDRVLSAQILASHTNRNAYDARTFTLSGSLERQSNIIWQKKWTWSVGGELVASDERDVIRTTGVARRRTYFIAAAPGSLAYDGTDDLLDPTRGYRLAGRLSPELSLQSGSFGYARMQVDASAYVPVSPGVVIAARTRIGSIAGAARDRIAPSRRFYAGGGGSVRGYGYQDVGPVDIDGDPVGGRSLAEFAVEGRVRFGDFGVVPFLDAGNLYTSALPRFTGLRYGAGLGARYYTSFGPIRVDVGTPLNRRRGDARIAVYVSLGQAF